jgi:Lrp/AsnC family transcriptional regulator for asnA, asnC and gidA
LVLLNPNRTFRFQTYLYKSNILVKVSYALFLVEKAKNCQIKAKIILLVVTFNYLPYLCGKYKLIMAHHNLDTLDKKILKLIASNARIPFLEVARACNVSGAAIHQRIQKLTSLGVLKGSQFIIDPEKIGYETCAYISLYLRDPSAFESVVEALKKIPEVVECHSTTGDMDLFIKMYAKNNRDLVSIIHDKLQPLGLSRSETIISFNTSFNRQLPIDKITVEEHVQEEANDA